MSISTLPPEVLAIIIGQLDTKSVYNLHEADVVCLQGLVTECQFSANTLATAKSLKTDFFAAVSPYVRVLNLCGVPNLNLPLLLDALSNMGHLIDLNVMYTNVRMNDFLSIVKVRPTLRSIAILFRFPDEIISQLNDDAILEYQKAFEGFENVNFIGPLHEDIHGSLALLMLGKAELSSLKFTSNGISEQWRDDKKRWSKIKMVKLSQFQLFVQQNFHTYSTIKPPIFKVMDFKNYEILIINANSDNDPIRCYSVFATPLMKSVISQNFAVQVECISDWPQVTKAEIQNRIYPGSMREVALMFWDKRRTTFNESFHKRISLIFKNYFILSLDSRDTKPVPPEFKWYSIKQSIPFELQSQKNPIVELDYGSAFKEKEDVKLDIMFDYDLRSAVPRMINNYDFLRKISHLFLHGRNINFDLDFFNNLFENCHTLVTLQVVNMGDKNFHPEYLQLMPKCKTLKNIFIVAPLKFSALFPYLSECKTLENICLNDFTFFETLGIDSFPDPSDLFSKCANLYNIMLTCELSPEESEMLENKYKKVQSDLDKDALNILICYFRYGYIHPYVGVFNTYQLKPL